MNEVEISMNYSSTKDLYVITIASNRPITAAEIQEALKVISNEFNEKKEIKDVL